jgi:hypothetical protein
MRCADSVKVSSYAPTRALILHFPSFLLVDIFDTIVFASASASASAAAAAAAAAAASC